MRAYGYNRPLGMGTYPKGENGNYAVVEVVNFDRKQWVEEVGRHCFGYVHYAADVPTEELERYELVTPEMFVASKPKLPPENVIAKMARAYHDGDWDRLEKLFDVAERKGYDMEALDEAVGNMALAL